MKVSLIIAASCLTLIASGCSKNTSSSSSLDGEQNQSEIKAISQTEAQKIANETDEGNRLQLLLKVSSSPTEGNELDSIIKLHSDKKLSHEEFRTLFWNAHISKSLIQTIQSELDNDAKLPALDKTLIQSIVKEDISFDSLLSEIKNDQTSAFPKALQSILIDELLKTYNKDFENINNDDNRLIDKLTDNKSESNTFLSMAKKILEINFYKRKLESKRLVTIANTKPVTFREIKPSFNLNYGFNIGRCGNYTNNIQNFTKLTSSFGRQCNTETPSVVNLDLYSDVTQYDSTVNINLLVNSFTRGGYDKGHGENGTSTLNYNLNGKITIPKCSNPSFCNQIVTVTATDFGTNYQGSNLTNDNVRISVNGNNFANTLNNSIILDVSTNDAVIDITFTGNKKHVGACCFNSPTFQKVNLSIQAGAFFESPLDFNVVRNANPFRTELFTPYMFNLGSSLNSPTFDVSILKQQVQEALKDKATLDNYRSLFYGQLELNQMAIDALMSSNAAPVKVLDYRQRQVATSDLIGRNMILPIINSKMLSYQTAKTLNVQKNINDMIKSILQMNLNLDDSQEEVKNKISSHISIMDSDSQEIAKLIINTLESSKKDQKQLLLDIEAFQNEIALNSKRMNMEMELLNLEKAQFEELGANVLGKVQ